MTGRAWRRWRGAILRAAYRRPVALGVGAVLGAASFVLAGSDAPWWARGVALVGGATGVAFVLAGLLGRRPDWVDPADRAQH